jgi:enterochelin esterase-like enzyme
LTREYVSKTTGTTRKVEIYTPPGYSEYKKYPVLYLLHGIGGTENEWKYYSNPDFILDNLYAQNKLVPMIVVFPNGRAMKDDRSPSNLFTTENVNAFANFEYDLLNDLIPFIDANYPVLPGPENRAIAGYSMGGGQALNFGLGHMDKFAWVGGFSVAPNAKTPSQLVPKPENTNKMLKLLWISCGDQDGLLNRNNNIHTYFTTNDVKHVWFVVSGAHETKVWQNDLYNFSQLVFKNSDSNSNHE